MDWKDRIVECKKVNIMELGTKPYEKNHRRHSDKQRKVFNDIATDLGVLDPIKVNKNTGTIVDGHMRLDEALKTGNLELWVWA